MRDSPLAHALVNACLAGEQSADAILARVSIVARGPRRVLQRLVAEYLTLCTNGVRPRRREVLKLLRRDGDDVLQVLRRDGDDGDEQQPYAALRPRSASRVALFEPSTMQPAVRDASWGLPAIVTVRELADWLGLTIGELEWFSDCRDLNRRAASPRLGHYHYTVLTKRHGGVRLIEAPQARLKSLQRQILSQILDHVPPYYTAAHGFVKGRSVHTFAAQHVGSAMLLRMDLADFFPCVSGARVQSVFRTLGYPEPVADLLGGICTTTTPRRVFASAPFEKGVLAEAARVNFRPHLPQGAPTSPALANLCAFRLDCRLTGLADWLGATYSRYADDLAFSGGAEFARRAEYVSAQVASIALDEGWRVQHQKTRLMRQGVRQQLAGLTVNARVNISRDAYDRLKATLTNCVRRGPATQNNDAVPDFRAHLTGRVAWVTSVNPERGRRLRALLEQIAWE